MQFTGDNERPRRAFLGYLNKSHRDLYLPESPFGQKPVERAFELLYLRPPQVAKWATSFALKTWPLDSAPKYVKVFRVVSVNAADPQHHPWERVDGAPIPRLARVQIFDPPSSPVALSVYSDADDQRILSKSADTQIEATERGVLEHLDSLIPVAGQTLTADEELEIQQRRAALLSQLNHF
jgi:hypothetical protein